MNIGLFIQTCVMPILLGVCAQKNVKTYNARTDAPTMLGLFNAAMTTAKIQNRHRRLPFNFILNGSLRSSDASAVVQSPILKSRLVAMLKCVLPYRKDVADAIGFNADSVDKQNDTTLLEAYKTLNDGALNVEDYGFYRLTCGSQVYRSRLADDAVLLSRVGNGEYRIDIEPKKISDFNKTMTAHAEQISVAEQKKKTEAEQQKKIAAEQKKKQQKIAASEAAAMTKQTKKQKKNARS